MSSMPISSYVIIASCAFVSLISVVILVVLLVRTSSSRAHSSLVSDIQQKLGSLAASAQYMQELGKDMRSLQTILSSPKLRGNFGEYLLTSLLKDAIPAKNYETQYHFSDGSAVDAVIKLGNHLVCIDSKFPMESFQRLVSSADADSKKKARSEFVKSVKARVDEISKKYIRPNEGTFDFALMYIPSESVYYEILTNDTVKKYELFEYAMQNRVIPVSPNTFYAYLMSVAYGLRGLKIEQKAEKIISSLSALRVSCKELLDDFDTLGKHLSNAGVKYADAREKALSLTESVRRLTED